MSEPYSLPPLEISEHERRTTEAIYTKLVESGIDEELAERESRAIYAQRFESGEYDGEYYD